MLLQRLCIARQIMQVPTQEADPAESNALASEAYRAAAAAALEARHAAFLEPFKVRVS